MTLTGKHTELIQKGLEISRTILDIGQSKLANEDTYGASRAVRNAGAAIEGIRDLLGALEMSDNGRHLLTEFRDLQKLIADLQEKIAVARRALGKGSTADLL